MVSSQRLSTATVAGIGGEALTEAKRPTPRSMISPLPPTGPVKSSA
jgi:hypothetical protein